MQGQAVFLASGLALIAAAPAAHADWQYTHWGMTPAQVAAASHGAVHVMPPQRRLGPTGPDIETRAEGIFVSGKLRLDVSFGFDGHTGGLVLVSYLVHDASQNYLLREALVKQYGAPQPSGDADSGSGIWRSPGHDTIDLSISDEDPAFVVQRAPSTLPAGPPAGATRKP